MRAPTVGMSQRNKLFVSVNTHFIFSPSLLSTSRGNLPDRIQAIRLYTTPNPCWSWRNTTVTYDASFTTDDSFCCAVYACRQTTPSAHYNLRFPAALALLLGVPLTRPGTSFSPSSHLTAFAVRLGGLKTSISGPLLP